MACLSQTNGGVSVFGAVQFADVTPLHPRLRDLVGQRLGRFAVGQVKHILRTGAEFQGFDTLVGVDVIVAALDPEVGEDEPDAHTFRRIATLVHMTQHPGCQQVVAHGVTPDGIRYLVWVHQAGVPLRKQLETPRSSSTVEAVARAGLQALAHLHRNDVVHGDVSPDTILIDPESADFRALIGFGPEMVIGPEQQSKASRDTGAPWYGSPERLEGHQPDARSDLYSLGLTLYTMLTGLDERRARAQLRDPFVDAGDNPRLIRIISRLTALRPDARFQSADAALRALSVRAAGEPAAPTRPVPRRRPRRETPVDPFLVATPYRQDSGPPRWVHGLPTAEPSAPRGAGAAAGVIDLGAPQDAARSGRALGFAALVLLLVSLTAAGALWIGSSARRGAQRATATLAN